MYLVLGHQGRRRGPVRMKGAAAEVARIETRPLEAFEATVHIPTTPSRLPESALRFIQCWKRPRDLSRSIWSTDQKITYQGGCLQDPVTGIKFFKAIYPQSL